MPQENLPQMDKIGGGGEGRLSLRAETHLIPDQSHSFEQSSVALINKIVGDSLRNVCLGYHQLIAWIAFEDNHQATGTSSWRGTHFENTEQNTAGHSHAIYLFEEIKEPFGATILEAGIDKL